VRPFGRAGPPSSAHCRVLAFDQRTVTRLPVTTEPAAPPCCRRGPRAMPVERNQVVVCYRSPYERIAWGGLPAASAAAADSRLQLGPAQPGSPAMLLAGLRQWDRLCEVRLRGGWLPPQLPLHGGAAADRRTGEPHPGRARTEGGELHAAAAHHPTAPRFNRPWCDARIVNFESPIQQPSVSTHLDPARPSCSQPLYVGAEAAAHKQQLDISYPVRHAVACQFLTNTHSIVSIVACCCRRQV
jgi:hypothetical protein